MSDTITPKERAEWRNRLKNGYFDPDHLHELTLRLLTALEAAEKALLKEEVYSEELESQLQDADGEYNANWAVQAISDVARLVGVYEQCSETGDGIGAAVIEAVQDLKSEKDAAEAESARLRAERDWLANKLIDCPPEFTNCAVDCAECRTEAARRAVAAGEG